MTPIPTEWWLRPVSKAARVGAHRAVVWKRLYFRPFPARRSAVGVAHGPPNALEAAKPTSSSRTTSTFGAPSGGRSGSIGGDVASGSLASRGSSPSYGRSGIGRTSRELWSVTLYSSPRQTRAWALRRRTVLAPAGRSRAGVSSFRSGHRSLASELRSGPEMYGPPLTPAHGDHEPSWRDYAFSASSASDDAPLA